jgi:type VI protein secretion system component VasF
MILAQRPRGRQRMRRILFWLSMLATIAAGVVVYLYLTQ